MPTNGPSGSGMQKFGSARLAAGRRPPSVRLSKCFCGRLQIVPKAPSVKKSEHSARWGPPNSRGTHGRGAQFSNFLAWWREGFSSCSRVFRFPAVKKLRSYKVDQRGTLGGQELDL